jgi:hypothetical protein
MSCQTIPVLEKLRTEQVRASPISHEQCVSMPPAMRLHLDTPSHAGDHQNNESNSCNRCNQIQQITLRTLRKIYLS